MSFVLLNNLIKNPDDIFFPYSILQSDLKIVGIDEGIIFIELLFIIVSYYL